MNSFIKDSYADNFCLSSYKEILLSFIEKGYLFTTYEGANPNSPNVILRHDIDNSLEYAIEVAKIESLLGIKSYYFVLLRTEFYNIFSSSNEPILREIIKLGHYIGLHFDTSIYRQDTMGEPSFDSLSAYASIECDILEKYLNTKVRHISFHRPSKLLINHEGDFAGRISVYNKKYFSEIGYCSDSQGQWRFGHPLNHPAFEAHSSLQLLTHPIWWVEKGISPKEKLNNFLNKLSYKNIREMTLNNKSFTNPSNKDL